MSTEKTFSNDVVSSGLVAAVRPVDSLSAVGRFTMTCYDKDGNVKWEDAVDNLVVNVGLQYMAGAALTSTAQITSWYIGLFGSSSTNTPASTDTMSSHGGWTESTGYNNATRPTANFAAATLPTGSGNPSVVTNLASSASFSINATATIGGAFLTSNNTKGGTSGTLFSAAVFSSPGNRTVANGDTLNVTYTMNLSA